MSRERALVVAAAERRAVADEVAGRLARSLDVVHFDLPRHGDREAIVRAALDARPSLVVAVGGDGTVSAAAHACVQVGAELGIVPAGTSNSIARALGIPRGVRTATEIARHGSTRRIDGGRVEIGDRVVPMVLLASVGVHTRAIHEAPVGWKAALGRAAYVLSAARALACSREFEAELTIDGQRRRPVRGLAITVASFAPRDTLLARGHLAPDDGTLDVTVLRSLRAAAASLLARPRAPLVTVEPCRRITIATDPRLDVLVDGDVIAQTPIAIAIRPGTLHVRVP